MTIGDLKRKIAGFPNATHVVVVQPEDYARAGKYDVGSVYEDMRGVVVLVAETRAHTIAPRQLKRREIAETIMELSPCIQAEIEEGQEEEAQ